MVDKSWGISERPPVGSSSEDTGANRAAERSQARLARAQERADAMEQRSEAREAQREADRVAREQARSARREDEAQRAAGDPHAAAAARRRGSGRKDVVREQRDIRAYTTLVDAGRIRTLAGRGASLAGLAGAFGITVEAVAAILAAAD